MKRLTGRLRVRLALTGFAAIYTPVLVLLLAVNASSIDENVIEGEVEVTTVVVGGGVEWTPIVVTVVLLAPVAALLAWWWSGRAVRPIEEAIAIQERLIEEASHELRTPLAVLSNNAEVLLAHPEPSLAVYRRGLERSKAAAERMSATIESLLVDARGRARTIVRRPTDLGAVVDRVVDELEPLAVAADVTIRAEAAAPVEARVDRATMERAVANLVTNAVNVAPPGSAVTVRVEQREGSATVSVTDQGPGLSPEQQANVFDRYWQADRSDGGDGSGGSGIGLSIVRQIAQAHGGDVTVTSPVDDGRGSRFLLTVAR